MSLLLRFDSDRAREWVRCIEAGEPLTHSGAGWTAEEMLSLAGMLHFVCVSHGPVLHEGVDFDSLSDERREAITIQLLADLEAAIRLGSKMSELVVDDHFDQYFRQPIVEVLVEGGENLGQTFFKEGQLNGEWPVAKWPPSE